MSLDPTKSYSVGCSATKTIRRAVCLVFGVLLLSGIIVAQTRAQNTTPVPPSGLKRIGFGFLPKTVTRLELAQINTNPTTIPTDPLAYRAEMSVAPAPGKDYYQYEPQSTQFPYAVLTVKNETNKTVESVDWEFNYPRFKGGKEEVKYQASTRLKIPPGQVASLARRVPRDDCGIRYVADRGSVFITRVCGRSNPKVTGAYPVEAEIKRVKFTDGTIWQAP